MRPLLQPELYLNAALRPFCPFWLIPLRAFLFPILSQRLSAPGGDHRHRQVKESTMFDWQHVTWELNRLLLAGVVGAAIGFEREAHGQAAGLRTFILVSVGACLMMMLSLEMEEIHRHLSVDQSVVRLDPARIASYAIASMGFLGAGAIITGRGSVRGLTTAAGLWLATGLGLAIGAGYLIPALFAAGISLIILYALRLIKKVFAHDLFTILTLKYHGVEDPLDQIRQILKSHNISIQFINYTLEPPSNLLTYRFRLQSKDTIIFKQVIRSLAATEGLQEVNLQEGEVP
jgi:putative Mg2+ transporter-C (MgtC) family protein